MKSVELVGEPAGGTERDALLASIWLQASDAVTNTPVTMVTMSCSQVGDSVVWLLLHHRRVKQH